MKLLFYRFATALFGAWLSLGANSLQAAESPSCPAALPQQQRVQVPVGKTYYLPLAARDASGSCRPLTWALAEAPEANRNGIRDEGDDVYARFVPHLPGRYVFRNQHGEQESISVIDRGQQPFINYNYYPTQALQAIGQSIWVTNVLRNEVAILDRADLKIQDTIAVGAWPVALAWAPAQNIVLVAQKGEDNLGVIDLATQRLVDTIWVGDEPSNIVVAPRLGRAFIALATEDQVAVLDLATRTIIQRIGVGSDPQAMALAPDESRLYVASRRSGKPGREPYGFDDISEEKDIAIIDSVKLQRLDYIYNVATTINSLVVSDEGRSLLMAHLLNDTVVRLADPNGKAFEHRVTRVDTQTASSQLSVDLGRQATAKGAATGLFGLNTDENGDLWVLSEGLDLLIQLDRQTLEEKLRIPTLLRPRSLLVSGGELFVFSHQALRLAKYRLDGTKLGDVSLGVDPRPRALAKGHASFTQAGQAYAVSWSCNSCHLDGGTDTNVWNAGPFVAQYVPRPIFWQEGTAPIGWPGYMSSVRNSGIEAHSIIGIRPKTEDGEHMGAYLRSLTVPPAANTLTLRDGSISPQAEAGRSVFQGVGQCASCHAMPLATNNQTLPEGITPGPSNIPSLVGAYRHKIWLKHGQASTLEKAVEAAAIRYARRPLDEAELQSLTRYLKELTGRDFFVLSSEPSLMQRTTGLRPEIRVTFSLPAAKTAANLQKIRLLDSSGALIATEIRWLDDRHLTVIPREALASESRYQLLIDESFQSWDGRGLQAFRLSFGTLAPASLRMEGRYDLKIKIPGFDPVKKQADFSKTAESVIPLEVLSVEDGVVRFRASYHEGLSVEDQALLGASTLSLPPLPVPVFGGNMIDGFSGFRGSLLDTDGDGLADRAEGQAVLSGPGILWPVQDWVLERR